MAQTSGITSIPCLDTMLARHLNSGSSAMLGRGMLGLKGKLLNLFPVGSSFPISEVVVPRAGLPVSLVPCKGTFVPPFRERAITVDSKSLHSSIKTTQRSATSNATYVLQPTALKHTARHHPLLSKDELQSRVRNFQWQCNCQTATADPPLATITAPPYGNLKLHNTMTRQKEVFRPRVEGRVGMYVCGVTAYDFSHIGHARVYVWSDCLFRQVAFKSITPSR